MTRRTILVLDDDEEVTELYSAALRAGGMDVVVCNSYRDARARLNDAVPDGLLADVRLGEFNGLQLVHFFRSLSPEAVVVVATGHDDAMIRTEAANLGATFMLKPVDITTVVRLLKGGE